MKIYVVFRDTDCFCDSLHIVGVATDEERANYIASVTGDEYSPCHIEVYDTDAICPQSLLRYQVYTDNGRLVATYTGDDDDYDDDDIKSCTVFAHNHEEALAMAKDTI